MQHILQVSFVYVCNGREEEVVREKQIFEGEEERGAEFYFLRKGGG